MQPKIAGAFPLASRHPNSAAPSDIVITDIIFNHLDKVPLTGEPSAVISLPLQDPTEALHRAAEGVHG